MSHRFEPRPDEDDAARARRAAVRAADAARGALRSLMAPAGEVEVPAPAAGDRLAEVVDLRMVARRRMQRVVQPLR